MINIYKIRQLVIALQKRIKFLATQLVICELILSTVVH